MEWHENRMEQVADRLLNGTIITTKALLYYVGREGSGKALQSDLKLCSPHI